MTSCSTPAGVRTTTFERSARSGSTNRGTYCPSRLFWRNVSHGNPADGESGRTNAHRRSPENPCHATSTALRTSAAIDLTG